tara:strand:+ start:376 stop:1143 length:768 start_codon:yes stop_codon:yes gene_type:complete
MKKIISYTSVIFLLFFVSCAGSKVDDEMSLQEKFKSGLENLEKGKYLQAQIDFNYVVIRGTGSDLGDDAQYYLAEAYYQNKEYLEAVAEYEKLTRRMGFSPFIEDARFKICEAYRIESPKYFHDQEYTEKALERYQEFLDDFPNSKYIPDILTSIGILRQKMATKLYETGILYIKMEEYDSAKMIFNRVIDTFYDTAVVHLARQGKVKALAQNRQIDEALEFLNDHESKLKENGLYEEAEKTILNIQKKIAKETE